MVSLKILLDGLRSTGGAGRARKALLGIKGVVKVITSLDDHTAEVTFDERAVARSDLLDALREAGFAPPEETGPNGQSD
jgi:copper chaperone CopZ